jgi:hypothetical protein
MTTPQTAAKRGRPPLAPGETKDTPISWRSTAARRDKAQRLADEAGISMAAWLDRLIDRAKS